MRRGVVRLRDIDARERDRLEAAFDVFRPEVEGRRRRHAVRVMRQYELDPAAEAHRPVCAACGVVRGVGFVGPDGLVAQCDPHPADRGIRVSGLGWACTPECRGELRAPPVG